MTGAAIEWTEEEIAEIAALFTPEELDELERWVDSPLTQYLPRPGQLRFHQHPAKWRMARGPNQIVGKSYAASAEWHWWALGIHPYRETPPPPIDGLLIPYSDKSVKEVERALFELLPDGVLDPACKYHQATGFTTRGSRILTYANGSNLVIATSKGGAMSVAGGTKDLVWFDEPPEVKTWDEGVARINERNGDIIVSMTPINRPVGFIREKVNEGLLADIHILPTPENTGKTPERLEEIRLSYLAAQRAQRFLGEWEGVTIDRYFDAFDPTRHVTEELPDIDLRIGMAFDHGERPGKQVGPLYAWYEVDGVCHVYCFAEYANPGRTTTTQDALRIATILEGVGLNLGDVERAHGDVNTFGKAADASVNDKLTEAFADLWRANGALPFRVRKPPGRMKRRIVTGCKIIHEALLEDRLKIHPRCTGLIHALSHWKGGSDGDEDVLKGWIDALRYGPCELLDTGQSSAGVRIRVV